MTNHYHLIVKTLYPNLARGMRNLNGVYAQWFNRRRDRVGHLFQGRYKAMLVQSDKHLHSTVVYIVRNPVRAGVFRHVAEWPWTSHNATLGTAAADFVAVGEVLSYLGPDARTARRRYLELVSDDQDRPHQPTRSSTETTASSVPTSPAGGGTWKT